MPNAAPGASGSSQPTDQLGVLTRVRRIGWRGLVLRLEALLLLRHIVRAMKLRPFAEVRDALLPQAAEPSTPTVETGPRAHGDAERAAPVGGAVASVARFVPGALCVSQALATQVMLTRRGEGSVLHFGFLRSGAGQVEGHAWLEVDGSVVIGDGGLDSFTRTGTFES